MGIYIGCIERKISGRTVFFNFKPLAEVLQNEIRELNSPELDALLPQSSKHDINFSYQWDSYDELNDMDAFFQNRALVVFEFVLSDLEDNIHNGVRKPTGYQVNALDMLKAGKIRNLCEDGVYQLVRENDDADFYAEPIVEIDVDDVMVGRNVFVDLGDFVAGPYAVDFRQHTQTYYIRPEIKNSKYTISGYSRRKCPIITLLEFTDYYRDNAYEWTVMLAREGIEIEQQDVISDALLLESFRESIGVENIKDGRVVIDDIQALVAQYETSLLSGAYVSEAIRKKRLNRLVELLTSEEELTDTLSFITESICGLLVRYKDLPEVEAWLQEILAQHPEFWEQIRDVRIIDTKIAQLSQDFEDLQNQHSALEVELQEKREAVDAINQQAIEEKKKEMLAVDTEYAETKKRLDALLETLGMVQDFAAVQKQLDRLKEDVTYFETHKRHLENDARNLEAQFSQLITNQHDKMLGVSFDGFMASKMLKAAAEWEAEEARKIGKTFVESANALEASNKTPDELVDYIIRTVQIVRPQYTKNTIINIAICTTQGFLTVFSGEPGCGKTSICNIFANVLGLNKIEELVNHDGNDYSATRYVPVSVERGWTSKRDFVGYFNPLSKSFDKSNRDVYDALSRLHIEKTLGINKFPFVMLLDEANLSPMEYYWADFMYICDNTGNKRMVNLGDNNVLSIPETLHFVATINNDHTTETLSPRLIDRAWIVQLPQQFGSLSAYTEISKEQIELISWESLRNTFGVNSDDTATLSADVQRKYDAVIAHLRKAKIYVSPRVEIAIKNYWIVAASLFEKELGIEPDVVAIDYAIAQKILPKIQGHGDEFENWLDEFRTLLNTNDLNMSAKIVKDIVERGGQQMKYFQFFA